MQVWQVAVLSCLLGLLVGRARGRSLVVEGFFGEALVPRQLLEVLEEEALLLLRLMATLASAWNLDVDVELQLRNRVLGFWSNLRGQGCWQTALSTVSRHLLIKNWLVLELQHLVRLGLPSLQSQIRFPRWLRHLVHVDVQRLPLVVELRLRLLSVATTHQGGTVLVMVLCFGLERLLRQVLFFIVLRSRLFLLSWWHLIAELASKRSLPLLVLRRDCQLIVLLVHRGRAGGLLRLLFRKLLLLRLRRDAESVNVGVGGHLTSSLRI